MTVKTALVTGRASGIGKAIAERLAIDGYQVATLDLTGPDPNTDTEPRSPRCSRWSVRSWGR